MLFESKMDFTDKSYVLLYGIIEEGAGLIGVNPAKDFRVSPNDRWGGKINSTFLLKKSERKIFGQRSKGGGGGVISSLWSCKELLGRL